MCVILFEPVEMLYRHGPWAVLSLEQRL